MNKRIRKFYGRVYIPEQEELPKAYDFVYWFLIGIAFMLGMYSLRLLQDYLWANIIIY
jgi:hypothetical protein